MYTKIIKRIIDICIAVIGIVFLSPLLFILFFLVRFMLGSPVIFKQLRAGYRGKSFVIYKFRTMKNDFDRKGDLLPDDTRLTSFGKFLRRTSLDELPQLLNVLKGEMSLIGPRPHLVEYLFLYTKEQARRHEVKPGITGWAQVNGRNSLDWEEKFKLDVWYIDHVSFLFDIKIFWLTIIKVLRGDGVNKEGHVTTERFAGSNKDNC